MKLHIRSLISGVAMSILMPVGLQAQFWECWYCSFKDPERVWE